MGQPGLPHTAIPQYTAPAKGSVPPTVRRAVLFMRVGAALTAANGLVMVLLTGQASENNQTINDGGSTTSSTAYAAGYVIGYMAWYLAIAGLWLWMAQANKAGKNWARITSTVFFGISCLVFLISLVVDTVIGAAQGGGLTFVALAIICASWIIGLFTVILLWNKKSAPHFKSTPTPLPAYGPGHYYQPAPQSNATMHDIAQHQPMTDPWSTPRDPA